jgi:hypothetical protein
MASKQLNRHGQVTIGKDQLRQDGILDGDEIPEQQTVFVDRLERRTYLIRFPAEDGSVGPLSECEIIRQKAAQIAIETPGVEVRAD